MLANGHRPAASSHAPTSMHTLLHIARTNRWYIACAFVALVIIAVQLESRSIGLDLFRRVPLVPEPVLSELHLRARSVCDPVSHECQRRLTWDELHVLLDAGTPQYISRLTEAQAVYAAQRRRMAKEYASVSDAVRHQKFGTTCESIDGKLHCPFATGMSAADIAAQSDPTALPDSLLVPNDFPYALEVPIRHEVIWTRVPLHGDPVRVQRLIERYFPAAEWQTMSLVNPVYLQTIKDIFHIHVFVRPRTKAADDEPT